MLKTSLHVEVDSSAIQLIAMLHGCFEHCLHYFWKVSMGDSSEENAVWPWSYTVLLQIRRD